MPKRTRSRGGHHGLSRSASMLASRLGDPMSGFRGHEARITDIPENLPPLEPHPHMPGQDPSFVHGCDFPEFGMMANDPAPENSVSAFLDEPEAPWTPQNLKHQSGPSNLMSGNPAVDHGPIAEGDFAYEADQWGQMNDSNLNYGIQDYPVTGQPSYGDPSRLSLDGFPSRDLTSHPRIEEATESPFWQQMPAYLSAPFCNHLVQGTGQALQLPARQLGDATSSIIPPSSSSDALRGARHGSSTPSDDKLCEIVFDATMQPWTPTKKKRTLSNREETNATRKRGACQQCKAKKQKCSPSHVLSTATSPQTLTSSDISEDGNDRVHVAMEKDFPIGSSSDPSARYLDNKDEG